MSRLFPGLIVLLGAVMGAPGETVRAAEGPTLPAALSAGFASSLAPLTTKYCRQCHGGATPEADLSFDQLKDLTTLVSHRDAWESVVENVENQVMPPDGHPKPSADERLALVRAARSIWQYLDAQAPPDPGRITIRRLNRTEYNNTIRDLLYVDYDAGEDFPADDVGHGFDNVADVLSLSPVLMERYLAAAEGALQRAITPIPPKVPGRGIAGKYLQPSSSKAYEQRWRRMGTHETEAYLSGPLSTDYRIDPENEYIFRAKVYVESDDPRPIRVHVLGCGKGLADDVDDAFAAKLAGVNVKNLRPFILLGTTDIEARAEKDAHRIEVKFYCPPGLDRVALALEQPHEGGASRTLHVESFLLEGPLDTRPRSHRKLLASDEGLPVEARTREVLSRFASRAFRRPVRDDELTRLVAIAVEAQQEGANWEASIQEAMLPVLVSPKFLFRIEDDPQPEAREPHPIGDFALATRLSYFLWNTMPDEELTELARRGELSRQLEAQVRRMLDDPRSASLVDNFALQWLQLKRLSIFAPDPKLFPNFNERLRGAMLNETKLVFEEIVRDDRSLLDLIAPDFTYLNEPLARHYGIIDTVGNYQADKARIPGGQPIRGDGMVRVALKDGLRGGLLSQASILAVTSNPTRTSPVKRGRWVLEQLLGAPPPPPPPNVPELQEEDQGQLTGTLRQRMEQHRQNPACASCHSRMDPLGFALENYDAIGGFRTKEGAFDVDPSGVLPDGTALSGPVELKQVLLDKRETFVRSFVEKMLIYALGRGLERFDRRAVDRIVARSAENEYRFATLVTEIVHSEPFRLRRGKELE